MLHRLLPCLVATLTAGALLAPGLPLGPSRASGQDAPPTPDAPPPDAPPPAEDEPEAGPDDGGADKPDRPGRRAREPRGRQLDRDSPVAKALADLLVVDPKYAADGTVELEYDFKSAEHVNDWDLQGLDRAEEANRRGVQGRGIARGAAKPQALSLAAGSNSQGLFLHRLELKGDYEVSFRCHTERTTTRSELVFLLGKGGASWGTQLVQRGTRGFSVVGRDAVDKNAWTGGRVVTVTVAARGGELVTSVNGVRVDATRRLADKLDGRVGIYLTDMHLVVHHVTIKGTVSPAKL
ncbi:MAG: hypothetical protein M9894_21015 [Planctomycetes bacterium]|nr:hypothetical protein [Planctomycetota bacterium]